MHMDSPNESALAAALFYAAKGWRVVPTSGKLKHPVLDDWQNLATTDPTTIQALFDASPSHAQDVAIVTGPESGLFVLDVDPRHGGDETLLDLIAEHGPLPDTPMSITGSGGQHFLFRYPEGQEIRNQASKSLGPGLDIRGDNGQISAPPTIHENGNRYCWEVELHPEDVKVSDAPDWLIELLTSVPEAPPRAPRRERADGDLLPGDRFNEEHTWEELLEAAGAERTGWRRDRDGNVMEFWSRPRMDGENYFVPHTSATVNFGGADVLKVFTPNWPPLEEGHTYDKLGFWAEYSFDEGTHEEKVAKAIGQLAHEQISTEFEPWFEEFEAHLAEMTQVEEKKEVVDSSWTPVSLREARRQGPPPPPDLGRREDDEALLYRGKLHYFYGPPECGKSWAAQLITAQTVTEDELKVIYFDFENDAYSYMERLDVLGVDEEAAERVTYFNPDKPLTEAVWAYVKTVLKDQEPSLIVVDGISNAMSLLGCDPLTHSDAVKFEMMFLRPLCFTGAAVVCIDHAPKTQGDSKPTIFGAQHKLAQVTGATFLFQTQTPFARDMDGRAKLWIQKDKPGYLRRLALNGHIGDLCINSSRGFEAKIDMPTLENDSKWVPDTIMERLWGHISENPGILRSEVFRQVDAKQAWMRAGLERLIADGNVRDDLGAGRLYVNENKPFGEKRPSALDAFESAYGSQPAPDQASGGEAQAESVEAALDLVTGDVRTPQEPAEKPFSVVDGKIVPNVTGEDRTEESMARLRRMMQRDGFDTSPLFEPAADMTELAQRSVLASQQPDGLPPVKAEPERSEGDAEPGTVCEAKSGGRNEKWNPFETGD